MPDPTPSTPGPPASEHTFRRLWAAQSVSLLGAQVSFLAIPLLAVDLLQASPAQTGLLRAAELSPFLFLGLFAGVWVDRVRRRPILIAADLGRAALLSAIPAAAMLGGLRLELLYPVAFSVGVLAVFSDLAGQSFLPALVGRDRLQLANGRLELSRAVAAALGPGLAGSLVGIVSAPIAVAANAATYLASAALVGRMRREPDPLPSATAATFRQALMEGLSLFLCSPLLRALAGGSALVNLSLNAVLAVLVLFLARELGLGPLAVGSVFVSAGIGSVGGALAAQRLSGRLGIGRAIVGGAILAAAGGLALPAAGAAAGREMPVLLIGAAVFGAGIGVWNVLAVTLRQAATPDRLQGRVTAWYRTVIWGVTPVGSLIGGLLGEALGVRGALVASGAGLVLALAWVLRSPLPSLVGVPPVEAACEKKQSGGTGSGRGRRPGGMGARWRPTGILWLLARSFTALRITYFVSTEPALLGACLTSQAVPPLQGAVTDVG